MAVKQEEKTYFAGGNAVLMASGLARFGKYEVSIDIKYSL